MMLKKIQEIAVLLFWISNAIEIRIHNWIDNKPFIMTDKMRTDIEFGLDIKNVSCIENSIQKDFDIKSIECVMSNERTRIDMERDKMNCISMGKYMDYFVVKKGLYDAGIDTNMRQYMMQYFNTKGLLAFCGVNRQHFDDSLPKRNELFILKSIWHYTIIHWIDKKYLMTTRYLIKNTKEYEIDAHMLPSAWNNEKYNGIRKDFFSGITAPENKLKTQFVVSPNIAFSIDEGFRIEFDIHPDNPPKDFETPSRPPFVRISLKKDMNPSNIDRIYYIQTKPSNWMHLFWNAVITIRYHEKTLTIYNDGLMIEQINVDDLADDFDTFYVAIEVEVMEYHPVLRIYDFALLDDISKLDFYKKDIDCTKIRTFNHRNAMKFMINELELIYEVNDMVFYHEKI